MDNKIILELVAKNLDEIKLLVETLQNEEKADPLLIAITATKAKALYQELMLFSQNEPVLFQADLNVTPEEATVSEEDSPEIDSNELPKEEEVLPTSEIETNLVEIQEMILVETETNFVEIQEITIVETEIDVQISQPTEEPDQEIFKNAKIEDETELNFSQPKESPIIVDEVEPEPILQPVIINVEIKEELKIETHENKILGDQFISEPSVNEKLAASTIHESKVKGLPITNLGSAIGINDRFLFVRELFANDSKNFEKTVDLLNGLSSFLDAIDFLEKNFQWTKNEASLKFMELLKRRFEN